MSFERVRRHGILRQSTIKVPNRRERHLGTLDRVCAVGDCRTLAQCYRDHHHFGDFLLRSAGLSRLVRMNRNAV